MMDETLKKVKELLAEEMALFKGQLVNKKVFEKFSIATVEALEDERTRVDRLEK